MTDTKIRLMSLYSPESMLTKVGSAILIWEKDDENEQAGSQELAESVPE